MGVRTWGAGLVVAALVSAMGASGAPVVHAAEAPAKVVPNVLTVPAAPKPWQPTYDLPARLADEYVAETSRVAAPDKLVAHWPCNLPMRIYYAPAPSVDDRVMVKQLEYPVEYMRALGYDVQVVREVAYRNDYRTPVTPGDVLVVAPFSPADTQYMHTWDVRAYTDAPISEGAIRSAKLNFDANRGLSSDIILHELGHVLGLQHKPDTVMAAAATDSVSFDAAETAAVDCR